MRQAIYIIFLYLICLSFSSYCSDSIPTFKDIQAKNYSLKFIVLESSSSLSIINKKISGYVKRTERYIFSESDSTVEIFEDPKFFILSSDINTVMVGVKHYYNSSVFLVPFYDPYEILQFAQKNGSFSISANDIILEWNYKFNTDSFPVYSIKFFLDTSSKEKKLLKVQLTYTQKENVVMDEIRYEKVYAYKPIHYQHINNYGIFKNSKFNLNHPFANYTLFYLN